MVLSSIQSKSQQHNNAQQYSRLIRGVNYCVDHSKSLVKTIFNKVRINNDNNQNIISLFGADCIAKNVLDFDIIVKQMYSRYNTYYALYFNEKNNNSFAYVLTMVTVSMLSIADVQKIVPKNYVNCIYSTTKIETQISVARQYITKYNDKSSILNMNYQMVKDIIKPEHMAQMCDIQYGLIEFTFKMSILTDNNNMCSYIINCMQAYSKTEDLIKWSNELLEKYQSIQKSLVFNTIRIQIYNKY